MSVLEAIILGLIQGLAEFLPISSSGHLAIGHFLFGLEDEGLLFSIVVHIGTLIPVVVVFWRDIWAILRRPFQKMTGLLIVATLPAAVVGFLFEDMVEAAFASLTFIAFGFVITGLVLLFSDRKQKNEKTAEKITWLDAALIGIAQAVAILPGVSRSGSTIGMALARGIKREDAAKFAFLMSIPIILGATLLQVIHIARGDIMIYGLNFVNLGAGMLAAAISGYVAIRFMLAAIKKAKLRYFAYYVLTLAAIITVGGFVF
ncbi:MAG: undecaprenyl-diphosphate phosphatase [Defluviitaleaceae bacterium]|nr:undecaprenyl-diphosphate phosphatase [Defluviitaleaceae bacterium]